MDAPQSILISIPSERNRSPQVPTESMSSSQTFGTNNAIQANAIGAASLLAPNVIVRNREIDEITVNSFQLDALRDMAISTNRGLDDNFEPASIGDRGLVSEPVESGSPFDDSIATNANAGNAEPPASTKGPANQYGSKEGGANQLPDQSSSSEFELFPKEVTSTINTSNQKHVSVGTCAVCGRVLPQPIATQTVEVKALKPRFQRELKKAFPLRDFQATSRICVKDLHYVMQKRIDELLEEDQTQLAQLQDNAMRNLGEYEQQEQNWQKQFEKGWTFGEKAADLVARFGGSWRFIGCLLTGLALWATLNLVLTSINNTHPNVNPWDPYPFILLNLFLLMLAALQAPIIMMSQNRQNQLDRLQSDYISKIVLRAEHQVRHVNAKLDHLLSHQWKRLLEIQQTQVDLLQMLQAQHRHMNIPKHSDEAPHQPRNSSTLAEPARPSTYNHFDDSQSPGLPSHAHTIAQATQHEIGQNLKSNSAMAFAGTSPSFNQQYHWSTETQPDAHTRMLLGHHFGASRTETDDVMVFAHWHTDGDNFFGNVENVRFDIRYPGVVKRIVYDLVFDDATATLDDVFSGEGTVALRNDMDVVHMHMSGRILRLEVHPRGSGPVTAFANGDLPSRYKSAFYLKREDKITDFWKAPLQKVNITYSPPHQAAILHLRAGQCLERFRIDFFPSSNVEKARVYVRRIDGSGSKEDVEDRKNPRQHRRISRGFSYDQQQELFFLGGLAIAGPDTEYAGTEQVADTNEGETTKVQLEPVGYLREVIGARPLPSSWRVIAHALWPDNSVPGSNASTATVLSGSTAAQRSMFAFGGRTPGAGLGHAGIGVVGDGFGEVSVTFDAKSGTEAVVMEASNVTVVINEKWEGPATYILLCDETRVAYQGIIEEITG
ncbi:hypothetical protein HDU76_012333 [Blyttiomyces sp. JEL0837]|nr:hypothetical protein HDU76_012333 [Blyttiomyces sp. JEL0837]